MAPLPTLFARPGTRRRLEDTAIDKVVLIGSFVGAWNFGDLMQLRGVLRWHRERNGTIMLSPVHILPLAPDRERIRLLGQAFGTEDWIFSDQSGKGHLLAADLGLEQIEAGIQGNVTLHVYGGGFFNAFWGDLMLGLVEGLLAQMVAQRYVISGQQISPHFASQLGQHCRAYQPDLVGCRDSASRDVLSSQGVAALLSGDDAWEELLAVSGPHPLAPLPWQSHGRGEGGDRGQGGGVRAGAFGLYLNTSHYVMSTGGDSPGEHKKLIEDINAHLHALAQRFGRQAQPVLVSGYMSKEAVIRDTLTTLKETELAALVPRAATVDLIDLFKSNRLAEAAPILRRCHIFVSTSYHVAWLMKILGVPTYLFALNDYYRQKKQVLSEKSQSLADFLAADHEQTAREQEQLLAEQAAVRGAWLGALHDSLAAPPDLARLTARANCALNRLRLGATDTSRQLEEDLNRVLHSQSWRITAPLRAVGRSTQRLRKALKKT
jgi:hypothetical protein